MERQLVDQQQRDKLLQLTDSIRATHQTKHFVNRQREEQARIIENTVKAHLNHIVLQITDENTSDIALLNRVFSKRVDHTIRAAVNDAWILGINYVGGIKKRSHEMFITSSEVDQIKKLTAEFSQIFWRRVAVVLHEKDIKSARFSPRSSLTLSSLVTSIAAKIVTKAIAMATITKVNALKTATGSQPNSNKIATRSAAADGTDPTADPSLDTTPASVDTPPLDTTSATAAAAPVDILQWVTQHDERVCPFCMDLDGQQWSSDDPSLLTPPDDTHDNCRCRLDVVTPEFTQPDNTAFG